MHVHDVAEAMLTIVEEARGDERRDIIFDLLERFLADCLDDGIERAPRKTIPVKGVDMVQLANTLLAGPRVPRQGCIAPAPLVLTGPGGDYVSPWPARMGGTIGG